MRYYGHLDLTTAQTRWITVAVHTTEEWRYLCLALDLPDLIEDPYFATNAARVAHRQALIALLQERFRQQPAWWWVQLLGRSRVPCRLFMGYPEQQQVMAVRDQIISVFKCPEKVVKERHDDVR